MLSPLEIILVVATGMVKILFTPWIAFSLGSKFGGAVLWTFVGGCSGTLLFYRISAWLIEQESILHIHSFNSNAEPKATLLYLKEGREEYVGRMVPVSRDEAFRHDSWTFDTQYHNYYVCKMVE